MESLASTPTDELIDTVDSAFRVYGDNILETELIIKWARNDGSRLNLLEMRGAIDRPIYVFEDKINKEAKYAIQLCPGYNRWDKEPIENVFSEQPDIFLSHIQESGCEGKPVLAIESCDAVQAGNQAWQRFRRAYDAAEQGIPYIYLLPLIDWEHQSNGKEIKNPRYQTAQITLGQLALCSYYGAPSLQVYEITSWADFADMNDRPLPDSYSEFKGSRNGMDYIFSLLRSESSVGDSFEKQRGEALEGILKEMIQVAKRYSDYKDTELPVHLNHPVLTTDISKVVKKYSRSIAEGAPIEDDVAAHAVTLDDFRRDGTIFRKAAQRRTCSDGFYHEVLEKVNWKDSAKKDYKIEYLNTWGIEADRSLTSSELDELVRKKFGHTPVGYKDPPSEAVVIGNRKMFKNIIENAYPDIDEDILTWIEKDSDTPLLFVPLYGYKPSGDSRPDRGLLPLMIALFPDIARSGNLFVVMYSNRTPENWKEILDRGDNELWNVIRKHAGAIVTDVTKEGILLEG